MITVRRASERGHAQHGWLNSYHTFSFAEYYDPAHMGFRQLRVINEDRVQPGAGFPSHSHRDMEIISYVLDGALEHRDSLGNGSVIQPGDVQRMSAGTGITHSEYNPSHAELLHFLQIWILPAHPGLAPGYEQRHFPAADRQGRLRVVAAPDGRDGAVTVHQDVTLFAALLQDGDRLVQPLQPHRHAWLQVARGAVVLNAISLAAGDGAAVSAEPELTLVAAQAAEILLFDLA
jgi:redox-sensitive bicupin YhaK (pirin superfamily)